MSHSAQGYMARPMLGPSPPAASSMPLTRPVTDGVRSHPPVLQPPSGMTVPELAAKGVPRYPSPAFPTMPPPAPGYLPRPMLGPSPSPTSSMPLPRPLGNGLRPHPPVLKPPPGIILSDLAAKGVGQLVAPPEKPHTTVYVGKISTTVEDDVLRSILELCGPIKSWKRAQDPTTGSPKGFGFCEFESAEGVLRALRLLNKFALDGQELVLNVNQATREYLERYVARRKERERILKEEAIAEIKEEAAPGVEVVDHPAYPLLVAKLDGAEDDAKKFGLVTELDVESDNSAVQRLTAMLQERAKLMPQPPPLTASLDASGKVTSNADTMLKPKEGDPSLDRNDSSAKLDEEATIDHKGPAEVERPDGGPAAERGRRSERDKERDREKEMEREKDRELERYERERERERLKREREREIRVREAERLYEEREREWEARERERERQRAHDRERERDRERDRRREIKEQEEESDEEEWRKRRYRESLQDEKRKRRQREREEDLADVVREEQEVLEVKRQKTKEVSPCEMEIDVYRPDDHEVPVAPVVVDVGVPSHHVSVKDASPGSVSEGEQPQAEVLILSSNGGHDIARPEAGGDVVAANESELKLKSNSSNSAPRKLGFGLMGSGRRAAVPSVFHQEDEEEIPKERMLRPLVPIDYSAEEMQAVAPSKQSNQQTPGFASNLAAAAEFAKSLSNCGPSDDTDRDRSRKERDRGGERDKGRRDKDRGRHRDRDRERERDRDRDRDRDRHRDRDRERERDKEHDREKERQSDKGKVAEPRIMDAKQLIDSIPKTRDELFAYPVDWKIYDKHDLHERMRPWIAKKITEFLGEEENTLVEFIVNHTQKHVTASNMLGHLERVLDDEAEMFVLKMWRMLIFEIRRVETGLASRAKA